MELAVKMNNITKKFGKVIANDNVNLELKWGEVHGLVGENGAGKTTLMKVLYGMHQPNKGQLEIKGSPVSFDSPKDAIAMGIGMVHQHFSLVPNMSVAENIVIGKPPKKKILINESEIHDIVHDLSEKYKLMINPESLVKDLSVGLQQRVEILKALYLGADILILDEPTAVLTPQEIEELIKTLEFLKQKGKCIILITHKLNEVKEATDRLTVMRKGKVIDYVKTSETTEKEIARMMVGREVLFDVEKKQSKPKEVALDVKNISYINKSGLLTLDNISFQVRKGEILGIAGVQGNGQAELAEAVTGLIPIGSGSISINNKSISSKKAYQKFRQLGTGNIHYDRMNVSSSLNSSIRDNFLIHFYNNDEFKKGFLVDYTRANEITRKQLKKYSVKFDDIFDEVRSLSGGNMQKLIISREMYHCPSLLVASQPTRGVDIGATEFIYEQLIEHRDNGNAVLLISNDLTEIMNLSDRILVIYKGKINGELCREEATKEKLGYLMAGITNP